MDKDVLDEISHRYHEYERYRTLFSTLYVQHREQNGGIHVLIELKFVVACSRTFNHTFNHIIDRNGSCSPFQDVWQLRNATTLCMIQQSALS
jgi:5-methylcytosine-specific restriction endonuclease McrA